MHFYGLVLMPVQMKQLASHPCNLLMHCRQCSVQSCHFEFFCFKSIDVITSCNRNVPVPV